MWLCLDESNGPTFSTDGYTRARFTYNDLGNPLTTQFFDPLDKPGLQDESVTSHREEYNEFGKATGIVT